MRTSVCSLLLARRLYIAQYRNIFEFIFNILTRFSFLLRVAIFAFFSRSHQQASDTHSVTGDNTHEKGPNMSHFWIFHVKSSENTCIQYECRFHGPLTEDCRSYISAYAFTNQGYKARNTALQTQFTLRLTCSERHLRAESKYVPLIQFRLEPGSRFQCLSRSHLIGAKKTPPHYKKRDIPAYFLTSKTYFRLA